MDTLIQNLQGASTTIQALAVTVGGLIGVFATLTSFYLVMFIASKIKSKEASD